MSLHSSGGMTQGMADARYSGKPVVQTVVPTSGETVKFDDDDLDRTLYMKPAGTLATLTIAMPTTATSRLGRKVSVCSTQTVTLLTITEATMLNTLVTLSANDHFTFEEVEIGKWVVCQ